jgi:hypothetical protein
VRAAAAIAVLPGAVPASCGGAGPPPPGPPAPVSGEVRTPDARTPLVRAHGVFACATAGHVELHVSREGAASVALGGGLLASVSAAGTLINRSCEPLRPGAPQPVSPASSAAGEARLVCSVPERVVVDLRAGDVVVRSARSGRFLVGAAVGPQHADVAGYWSGACNER